ncbi:hypothetical protein OSB04_019027 [Centaurea solstitialis]|uniref:Uncharacterized protein n=1 Tax=Centaurea solstitialis TaxID=347529 RepID=A0AA38WDU2_9ASTR|nr:hypothetical protein OSB04_019027 [Centaurea solstitialis]
MPPSACLLMRTCAGGDVGLLSSGERLVRVSWAVIKLSRRRLRVYQWNRDLLKTNQGRQKSHADKVRLDLEFDVERSKLTLERKTKSLRNKDIGIGNVQREHRKGLE